MDYRIKALRNPVLLSLGEDNGTTISAFRKRIEDVWYVVFLAAERVYGTCFPAIVVFLGYIGIGQDHW